MPLNIVFSIAIRFYTINNNSKNPENHCVGLKKHLYHRDS